MKILKLEDCRKVYRDIVAGYSVIKQPRCYLKHLRDIDLGAVDNKSELILDEVKANKIQSEKDVLIALDKRGIWTKKDEENYFELIKSIKDLEQEKRKIKSREQAEQLVQIINQRKDELYKIEGERASHLSISAEYFVKKRSQEELIKISFFKDEELKQPLFSLDEFNDLEYGELVPFFSAFAELAETVGENNLKKISVCPSILNAFSLSGDDPTKFYGKSIVNLTLYQLELFNMLKTNKMILEQGHNPPDDYSDLDKIVDFFDIEYSILLGKIEAAKRKEQIQDI